MFSSARTAWENLRPAPIASRLRFAAIALLAGWILLPGGAAAQGANLKPVQISAAFLATPGPLIQYGTVRLVYELRLTNYSADGYAIDRLAVTAPGWHFSFPADRLKRMIRLLGPNSPSDGDSLAGGRTAVIYVMLDFPRNAKLPALLNHSVDLIAKDGSRHTLDTLPLAVSPQAPVIVEPPLRGVNWLAGDSVHNGLDAAHRRSIFVVDGQPWLAQRFAIDWVKVRIANGKATTWSGDETKNASYFCYNAPIYSVAAGTVVDIVDGLPENVPHARKLAIDVNLYNVAGNHVVEDIGGGRYVLYAHLRPGSLKVKRGDRVGAGQVLGSVGNSGNSSEPHLHMHIVDRPSFLAANGLPYEFTRLSASGPTEPVAAPGDNMVFGSIGPLKPQVDEYPANNALVTFP